MPTSLPDNLTDDDRLMLYLAGELPEGDAAVVRARLDCDADARQLAESFGRIDTMLRADAGAARGHETPAGSVARRVAATLHRLDAPGVAKRRRLRMPPKWTIYPVAAGLMLAGLMGGWWYSVRDEFARPSDNKYVDNTPPMLILPGRPDMSLEDLSEGALSRQFDSMVADRSWDRENPEARIAEQLAGLEYLKRVTR